MLTTDDITIVREVLGDAVADVADAALLSETRLAITSALVVEAVPGAAAETDPDRLQLINAIHAYLVGIDLLASSPRISSTRLAEEEIRLDPSAVTDIIAYWQRRYRSLTGRLNAAVREAPIYFTVARGGRG